MPTLHLVIILFLLLPFSAAPAVAEDTPEINLARGILVYEGFGHWLNFSYDKSGSSSDRSYTSNQIFRESYNASLQMALFDSRIFDVTMMGSATLDQNRSSGSGSSSAKNNSYQYNITGSGLSRSRIPFTINSLNSTITSLNTFTAPTTTNTFGNEFGITFLNDKLQSDFHYSRNSSDTKVDGTKSNSVSNSYSYSASHRYGTFSNSSLLLSFHDQSGSSSNGSNVSTGTNSLTLNNSLIFGAQRQFSLTSMFRVNNNATDKLPSRTMSLIESFSAALGKSLYFSSIYALSSDRSSDPSGQVRENINNQGDVSLSHKLFESLQTQLNGSIAANNQSDGTEKSYSMSGSANYSKKLTDGSRFSLNVSKGFNLVDRSVGSGTTTVRDELHPAAHQGNVIKLVLPGVTLRSVTAVSSRNPTFSYVEGIDYTVNYALGRITILSGGRVRIDMDGAGSDLYITYTVYKDPQIKFSSDSLALGSNLSLFNSQLTLGGSLSKSGQKIISGPTNNSLQDSRSLSLHVGGNYDSLSVRVSYSNETTGDQVYQSYEGELSAELPTDFASISLTAHDNYNIYGASEKFAAYRENTAALSLSLSKNILSNMTLSLSGSASDSRSELQPATNSLSLRVSSQYSLNLISINLFGQSSWNFNTNGTTRNDSVHADLTRYF